MHLPDLISDLALMLITAGIVTLLFKKIRQPLVLGYIVAGFLIGPYFSLLPSVVDTVSVSTWSEIGIIILMFYLGLDFNLHKLLSVGGTAIVTAVVEVLGMLLVGFCLGQLLGWSTMDSVFLGGMLSMSSTTIIIKAFDELGLRGKKFTELVFGTLVIEDIAGIFMMIILSTIAVSQGITGGELAGTILLLLLYLALWLLLGIFLLPTFLSKTTSLMNDETLLVVSLGACFGMVLLANALGFSSALGAFMAGSLLAGTVHAERVEHLTQGVRDLFGAVFFISVGMMVDPAMLVEHVWPIVLVTLATIIGKLIFSTGGMLLSGQPLSNAVHCGCSLAQIGEFAFIIASLGLSLGVISDFLYPIVVSVSVITTFTTPFCINRAGWATKLLQAALPQRISDYLNRYTDENRSDKDNDSDWQAYLKQYFFTLALYGVILLGVEIIGNHLLVGWLHGLGLAWTGAQLLTLALIYACFALFLRPMLNLHDPYLTALWLKSRSNRLPLIGLTGVRWALVIYLALLPLQQILDFHSLWLIPVVALLLVLASRSQLFASSYLQFEARFLANFNERTLERDSQANSEGRWLDEQLFLQSFLVPADATCAGKSLQELDWGRRHGAYAVKLIRGKNHLNLPPGKERLRENDRVFLLGEAVNLSNACRSLSLEPTAAPPTLRAFIDQQTDAPEDQLTCGAVRVTKDSPLANVAIRDSGIRQNWGGLLLGLQRGNLPIIRPDLNLRLQPGDLIWVLGDSSLAANLAKNDVLTAEA